MRPKLLPIAMKVTEAMCGLPNWLVTPRAASRLMSGRKTHRRFGLPMHDSPTPSLRNGTWGIYAKPIIGTANEELIVQSKNLIAPVSWSKDWLVYVAVGCPQTQYDMWRISTSGNAQPIPLDVAGYNSTLSQVSPNGRSAAYRSDETGRNQVYVQPFPTGLRPMAGVCRARFVSQMAPRWAGAVLLRAGVLWHVHGDDG